MGNFIAIATTLFIAAAAILICELLYQIGGPQAALLGVGYGGLVGGPVGMAAGGALLWLLIRIDAIWGIR